MFGRIVPQFCAILLLMAFPLLAADDDACQICDADETNEIVPVLKLEIRTEIDFSRATVGGRGGTISIDPENGTRTTSGSVVGLGGAALAGTALVQGLPGKLVRVEMPATVRMTNNRGGSLTITNLRTNLPPTPRLDGTGRLEFSFGGDLEINGAALGDYRGRIPITVDYE